MNLRRILGIAGAACAVLFLQLACVDPKEGASVSDTSLYVFDGASGKVLVWEDVSQVHSSASLPAADRILSGSSLLQVKALGWGGMAMDHAHNRLLLVSQTGKVVCINRVRSQNGSLSSLTDITLFTLGSSSDRLGSNSVFGQASVDTSTGTLYVTETTETDARIWVVANPGSIHDGATVPLSQIRASSGTDIKGTGVAAAQGRVFAYFGGGDNITNLNGNTFSGARVRLNMGSFFPAASQVLVYPDDTLGTTGSLGLDTFSDTNMLYVLRIASSGSVGDPPILLYKIGRFTGGFDQGTDATLGTATSLPNLRFISHAGIKDWLAGADMVGGSGSARLWLWRNPSLGGSPNGFDLAGGQILGIAFDGSN
jgi:hypothetical protein